MKMGFLKERVNEPKEAFLSDKYNNFVDYEKVFRRKTKSLKLPIKTFSLMIVVNIRKTS